MYSFTAIPLCSARHSSPAQSACGTRCLPTCVTFHPTASNPDLHPATWSNSAPCFYRLQCTARFYLLINVQVCTAFSSRDLQLAARYYSTLSRCHIGRRRRLPWYPLAFGNHYPDTDSGRKCGRNHIRPKQRGFCEAHCPIIYSSLSFVYIFVIIKS